MIAKRKEASMRGRPKEARKQRCDPMNQNRMEAYGIGRVCMVERGPYPSKGPVGKSGAGALKAVRLTSGDFGSRSS